MPSTILVTGDPIKSVKETRGTYADMIRAVAGDVRLPFVDFDIRARAALPDPRAFAGLVLT